MGELGASIKPVFKMKGTFQLYQTLSREFQKVTNIRMHEKIREIEALESKPEKRTR